MSLYRVDYLLSTEDTYLSSSGFKNPIQAALWCLSENLYNLCDDLVIEKYQENI